MRTGLYKHYDKAGTLLYVGVSLSVVTRLAQHRETAEWFNNIDTIKIIYFGTRKEAILAERKAIREECPKYNKQHVVGWKPLPRVNKSLRIITNGILYQFTPKDTEIHYYSLADSVEEATNDIAGQINSDHIIDIEQILCLQEDRSHRLTVGIVSIVDKTLQELYAIKPTAVKIKSMRSIFPYVKVAKLQRQH